MKTESLKGGRSGPKANAVEIQATSIVFYRPGASNLW